MRKLSTVLLASLLALLLLSGCGQGGGQAASLLLRGKGLEGVEEKELAKAQYIDLRDSSTDDLSALEACAKAEKLDLRGNDLSPEQIEALQNALPECEILWSVPFADDRLDSTTKRIIADPDTFDMELLENLRYFTSLEYCDLSRIKELDDEQVGAIHDAMPDTDFLWKIKLGRTEVMSNVTEVDITSSKDDLSKLKYCKKLRAISFRYADSVDISGLKEVTWLESLSFGGSDAESFEPLREMTWLKKLVLSNTSFDDLSIVSGMDQLEELTISMYLTNEDRFENLDPLKGMTSLRRLCVGGMGVRDASAVSSLTGLQKLVLCDNPIEDMSFASALTELDQLDLENTLVTDISFVSSLKKLESAAFGGVDEQMAKEGYGHPSVGKCVIEDYSPLEGCTALSLLIIDYTTVNDLSFVEKLDNLKTLSLSGDKLGDLEPITRQQNLRDVLFYDSHISVPQQMALILAMPNTNFAFELNI